MTETLQEYVDSRGVTVGVDRARGILRGVKLIGLTSRNGRRYRESALASAATLYEAAKVNINHPKDGPLAPRDYQDRLGVIRGVELRAGAGLFGDLHFNPKHALAEQLLWDAEHNPHNVGFSHNVLARLTREGETAIVEEITKVQSVDLVADPATTQGLFEQSSEHDPRWDALTREVLELHRPDLLEEIQVMQAQQAEAKLKQLQRKCRIAELLAEHGLAVKGKHSEGTQTVSPLFVDVLMKVQDERELETLVAERAELVRDLVRRQQHLAPQSRDQTLLAERRELACPTAREFATTLKSSHN